MAIKIQNLITEKVHKNQICLLTINEIYDNFTKISDSSEAYRIGLTN